MFPTHIGQGTAPSARLPRRMTAVEEYNHLLSCRMQIDERLTALQPIVERILGLAEPDGCRLPKSGLVLAGARGGAALFKGGRHEAR